ncbi:hypothetical protein WJX77_003566 [Trebouxia sp. C0004]
MANSVFKVVEHKTSSPLLRLAQLRLLILGDLQHLFQPAHIGVSIADMLEQWEAKAEEAGILADKKEFVAAAALAEEFNAVVLLLKLARLNHDVGDLEGALKHLAQADKLNPDNGAILQMHDEIKQELQDAASSKEASQQQHASSAAAVSSGLPAKQDAALQKEIDRLMAQSDYQRAHWLLPSHHDATPAAHLLCRVAKLKFLVKDFRDAAADLTTAEHLQPGDAATLQLHGRVKMELCDHTGAAEDLSSTADSAELLEL